MLWLEFVTVTECCFCLAWLRSPADRTSAPAQPVRLEGSDQEVAPAAQQERQMRKTKGRGTGLRGRRGTAPSTPLMRLPPTALGGSEANSGLSTGNEVLCF